MYPVIYNLYFNLFQRGEASAHPNQFPLTVYSVNSTGKGLQRLNLYRELEFDKEE